jgi:hypothetical protein
VSWRVRPAIRRADGWRFALAISSRPSTRSGKARTDGVMNSVGDRETISLPADA